MRRTPWGNTKPPPWVAIDPSHPHAAGLRAAFALNQGGGPTAYDAARRRPVAFAGSPAWQQSRGGLALGSFSSSDYVAVDPSPNAIAGYPFALSALFVNTTLGAAGTPLGSGFSGDDFGACAFLRMNNSTNGNAEFFVRGATTAVAPGAVVTAINDGAPHVLTGMAYSATDIRVYVDGRQVGTSTTNIGSMSNQNRLTIGAWRAANLYFPFSGAVLAAYVHSGAVPDPASLAIDPYAMFSAPTTRRIFAPAGGGGGPAVATGVPLLMIL